MNYNKTLIKEGITFHKITTSKFKTNLFAIFITTPLSRETVTKNALISAVLRRGTKNMPTQDAIAKVLENMYGASFDCGIEKNGDNHIMKFYIESINDEFLPDKDNLSKKSLKLLHDIVFNPLVENESFKKEYVDGEKNTLKQIIESKIDNKTKYALDRCTEELYKNEPYGLYKFGYVEDLDKINETDLYEYYKKLISTCKIDVFVSGFNIDNLNENEILADLNQRTSNYIPNKNRVINTQINEPNIVTEKMNVTQGKLMIGLDILNLEKEQNHSASVYNVILGGGANSKLFQNVREKASLAYTAGSGYIRNKNNIIIRCGIEIKNYEKATEIIKDQLNQMYNGDFSEENIESAKQLIYASYKSVPDTQDSELTYYFAQELSDEFVSLDENIEKVKAVTKEQILEVAKKVQINTIYFLTGEENN
ncbi:MAG: insulinase family protein [Clostridia bacterium]|nr:insulinase family protein [Clostridia bacterium]